MNDHAVALSLAHALAPAVGLTDCQVVGHDVEVSPAGTESTPTEITLPAILVKSESEPLSGSSSIAKAKVEIGIESQADDNDSATHAERVKAVRDRMTNLDVLGTAFSGRGIELLGKPCPKSTDPDTEQRAYLTVLTYVIGYSS